MKLENKDKILFGVLFILVVIFTIYIKYLLPTPFISYENYHGIQLLNEVYLNGNFSFVEYVKNQLLGFGPKDGHTSFIIYTLLFKLVPFNEYSIFYIQSTLSILTFIFFSLSVYFLSSKNKILSIFYLFLILTFPHQIKYGFSEDYYIIGNFFISISLFFFILFSKIKKIWFFPLFLITYILALYSRTLYLLYIPIFAIIFFNYFELKEIKTKKIFTLYNSFKIFFIIFVSILAFFPLYERFMSLVSQNSKFIGNNNFYIDKIINLLANIFSYPYIFLFFVGLFSGIIFFVKNKMYKNLIIFSSFSFYTLFILYKYSFSNTSLDAIGRHLLLLEPLYFILISIGVYFVYFLFKKYFKFINEKIILGILIILISLNPFINSFYIKQYFSIQKEFVFINENINKLGNNFNLIIPNNFYNFVDYEFPVYFFKKINNFDIYLYNIGNHNKNRFKDFQENLEKILGQSNIFYLSTACYSSGDKQSEFILKNGIREDCKYILDNFNLEPIVEHKMKPETYIIPNLNTPLSEITIGFYKIGKK